MKKTSIFIVPRSSTAWSGNEAGWITTSGWASAGQQLWGEAIVATTDGFFSPQEARLFPRKGGRFRSARINRPFRKWIPEFMITAYKDLMLSRSKPKIWPIEKEEVLSDKQVMMVWERHDLFPGPGRRLAKRFGVPLVISVEAAVVWEAKKWGVNRPVWGKILEKYVEAKSLKKANLITCVSEEVRDKVIAMGIPSEKVIVSHNRVDASVFHPAIDGTEIKEKYNLTGKRVLGWTGSFRGFHGIDTLLLAFTKVRERHPETLLMLVGDGLEFDNIRRKVSSLGLDDYVILPGRKPFTSIPSYVANFHVAVVSANSAEGFHYSPLKLREYLAAGKAIIAPRAGNLPTLFKDGVDLLLYEPGNVSNLAEKINLLLEKAELHSALQANAKSLFESEGTWLHELKKVCIKLSIGE